MTHLSLDEKLEKDTPGVDWHKTNKSAIAGIPTMGDETLFAAPCESFVGCHCSEAKLIDLNGKEALVN